MATRRAARDDEDDDTVQSAMERFVVGTEVRIMQSRSVARPKGEAVTCVAQALCIKLISRPRHDLPRWSFTVACCRAPSSALCDINCVAIRYRLSSRYRCTTLLRTASFTNSRSLWQDQDGCLVYPITVYLPAQFPVYHYPELYSNSSYPKSKTQGYLAKTTPNTVSKSGFRPALPSSSPVGPCHT
jgi:hypothetical protein